MSDQTNGATLPANANDGTVDGAALAFGALDFDTHGGEALDDPSPQQTRETAQPPRQAQPRDPKTQQFREKPKGDAVEAIDIEDEKPAAEAADTSAVEEEFFELPPEKEGGEPRRIKAADVWAGYQERDDLRQQIDKIQREAMPPEEWDNQIRQTLQARGELIALGKQYERILQPLQPDPQLLNPSNPNRDPELYYQQHQMAQHQAQQLAQVREQLKAMETEQKREEQALQQARTAREKAKVGQIWPELHRADKTGEAVRTKAVAAARALGFTDADFNSPLFQDARVYALLKKVVAHDDMVAAQRTAVKVVRSKPKLVRAGARNADAQQRATLNTAMQRVSSLGTLEAAADAFGALKLN